ncbi:hypothetical protein BRC83_06165 [Halobacteriales archaeon QS_1_68_17]|nr:MAG: hypothetical protein BRC83_06165 [Halobacteriales archaeon QS_1_68_17]
MIGGRVPAIVATEARHRLRAVGNSGGQAVALAIGGLFGVVFALGVAAGAFFAGELVADGSIADPLAPLGRTVGFAVLFPAALTAIRTAQGAAGPTCPDHVLLAARHREVVAGTLGVEWLVQSTMLGVAGLVAGVAFAAGAGSPASAVLVAVAVAALLSAGVAVGLAVGLGVRLAIARSRLLARFKTAVGVAVLLAYLAVAASGDQARVFAPAANALAATPVGWIADLALLAVAPGASVLRAGGALLAASGTVLAAGGAASWLADRLWYETPVDPHGTDTDTDTGRTGSGSGMQPVPGVARQTGFVARKALLRAVRSPIRLLYVVYPLFALAGPLSNALGGGSVPGAAVPGVALYLAWAAGAAFTLNPLGDETPVLPTTLVAPITGGRFVRGLWVAASGIGVPVALAAVAVIGVAVGLPPVDLVLVVALAAGLTALAPGLALGVGAAFPRTEPARVTRSRRAVVPSLFAFALYSLPLFVLSAPAVALSVGPGRATVASLAGVPAPLLGGAGVAGRRRLRIESGDRRPGVADGRK